jgi:hypothetical protein
LDEGWKGIRRLGDQGAGNQDIRVFPMNRDFASLNVDEGRGRTDGWIGGCAGMIVEMVCSAHPTNPEWLK